MFKVYDEATGTLTEITEQEARQILESAKPERTSATFTEKVLSEQVDSGICRVLAFTAGGKWIAIDRGEAPAEREETKWQR